MISFRLTNLEKRDDNTELGDGSNNDGLSGWWQSKHSKVHKPKCNHAFVTYPFTNSGTVLFWLAHYFSPVSTHHHDSYHLHFLSQLRDHTTATTSRYHPLSIWLSLRTTFITPTAHHLLTSLPNTSILNYPQTALIKTHHQTTLSHSLPTRSSTPQPSNLPIKISQGHPLCSTDTNKWHDTIWCKYSRRHDTTYVCYLYLCNYIAWLNNI